MATKKTTAPAAKVETKVEAPVKAAEVKAEVKTEAKAAPAKKAEPKKAEAKKETVKKETVKKEAPAKKAAAPKKAVSATVTVQFGGQEVSMDTVVENVKKAFEAEGNKVSAIKNLQVYVKPEEYAAYYVINQDITGKINLF